MAIVPWDRWTAEVIRGGRTMKTGRNYLDAMSGVFRYARRLKLIRENPVDALRMSLREDARTKRGRAEAKARASWSSSSVAILCRLKKAASALAWYCAGFIVSKLALLGEHVKGNVVTARI